MLVIAAAVVRARCRPGVGAAWLGRSVTEADVACTRLPPLTGVPGVPAPQQRRGHMLSRIVVSCSQDTGTLHASRAEGVLAVALRG